jgi:hypothetical protein
LPAQITKKNQDSHNILLNGFYWMSTTGYQFFLPQGHEEYSQRAAEINWQKNILCGSLRKSLRSLRLNAIPVITFV